jgi:2'-5' RNA ligase
VERARGAVKACENEVKAIIAERGINGRMIIEFDKLEIFGTPDETRVVYMKIKEDTDQFELLREVNHILI